MKRSWLLFFLLFFCAASFGQMITGTYAIKNTQTGLLLRIKDANKQDGTPLVAYSPVNWKCMTWNFQHVEGRTYRLVNLFTGKTFQSGGTPGENVGLVQQPLAENEQQQYEFIPAGNNTFLIRLKGTQLYVTPSDKQGSVNSPIILARKSSDKSQQWTIYEQHPDM